MDNEFPAEEKRPMFIETQTLLSVDDLGGSWFDSVDWAAVGFKASLMLYFLAALMRLLLSV